MGGGGMHVAPFTPFPPTGLATGKSYCTAELKRCFDFHSLINGVK